MDKIMKNLLIDLKSMSTDGNRELATTEVNDYIAGLQANAGDIMSTTEVGKGKELIPTATMGATLMDLIPSYSKLLPLLPGNHGTGLELREILPIIGEAEFFEGNTEWVNGDDDTVGDSTAVSTGEVTIDQGQFILRIRVSKKELAYSVEKLDGILRERIARSMARTIDALLINADSASSGNINLDHGTPSVKVYYKQQATGLRKVGLSNTVDIGTFDEDHIVDLADKIGDYASQPSDCLLIVNRKVYNKMLKFTNLKTYDKNKDNATILTGVLANIFGFDVFVHRDMPASAMASGKVGDGTVGYTNTTGTVLFFNKVAIQFGFGKIDEFEAQRVAGKGVILVSTFDFGQAVLNGEAGLPKMVSAGINITL